MSEEKVNEDEYIKVGEARSEFNIGHNKMTKLLKAGALPFIADELDERIKWLKRSDIIRLSAASLKRQRQRVINNNANINNPVSSDNENRQSHQGEGAVAQSPAQPVRRRGKSKATGSELKLTDKEVLRYLESICDEVTNLTPPVSLKTVAKGSAVSSRQVQVSGDRLVRAGLLQRMGNDPGHPDLTKRGMVYKVLLRRTSTNSLKLVS